MHGDNLIIRMYFISFYIAPDRFLFFFPPFELGSEIKYFFWNLYTGRINAARGYQCARKKNERV